MIDLGMGIKAPQAIDAPQNFAADPLPLTEQLKLIADTAAASALRHLSTSHKAALNSRSKKTKAA